MKVIKILAFIFLISCAANQALARKVTIQPSPAPQMEKDNWKVETLNDGMFFLLGTYSNKILTIHVNETTEKGTAADPVSIFCNAEHEDTYREHLIEPGMNLTCIGHLHDVITMDISPKNIKNGAQGTYEFIPLSRRS